MEDLSQTLASLRCVLSNGIKAADQSSLNHNLSDARTRAGPAGICTAPKECVVSPALSQYDLQALEHQARQEELEEECILAFQVSATIRPPALLLCRSLRPHHGCVFLQTQQASAPESSDDTQRDEEFDDEMMKVKVFVFR